MQKTRPYCGSTDLIVAELGNDESETLLDCEGCGERIRGDEA